MVRIRVDHNESIKKWKRISLYFTSIFNSIHLAIIITNRSGKIMLFNPAAEEAWGVGARKVLGKHILDELDWGGLQEEVGKRLEQVITHGTAQSIPKLPLLGKQDQEQLFHLDIIPIIDELHCQNGSIFMGTDITEKEALVREKHILEGLLPICSYCKKIRGDANDWVVLEKYISEHSDADFTHSICPECLDERFPEEKKDFGEDHDEQKAS